jgi:hypothetical protein
MAPAKGTATSVANKGNLRASRGTRGASADEAAPPPRPSRARLGRGMAFADSLLSSAPSRSRFPGRSSTVASEGV